MGLEEPGIPHQREGEDTAGGVGEGSDSALLRRMRGGDTGAYDELYRRHADAVRRYARTCCRDAYTAEDLTNEVFARALQAVRRGAGPETAVRAYLLTSVRRVAATWTRTAQREYLVEDFAVFAQSAAAAAARPGGSRGSVAGGVPEGEGVEAGADVRAMQQAERTLAVQAFRSLPEKYQTVLWHTAVEDASPRAVAPLLGLSDNATAVLAHRAREKLKQAYLQAHVSRAVPAGGDCAHFAYQLGAYTRGRLRSRAERGMRTHLERCAECRSAATEIKTLNEQIRVLVPVAVVGWFGAGGVDAFGGVLTGAGAAGAGGVTTGSGSGAGGADAGGAAGTGGGTGGGSGASAGTDAAGTGFAGTGADAAGAGGVAPGGATGGAAAEGIGAPVKAGVTAGVVAAATLVVILAVVGSGGDADSPDTPQSQPSVAPRDPSGPPPQDVPERNRERPGPGTPSAGETDGDPARDSDPGRERNEDRATGSEQGQAEGTVDPGDGPPADGPQQPAPPAPTNPPAPEPTPTPPTTPDPTHPPRGVIGGLKDLVKDLLHPGRDRDLVGVRIGVGGESEDR